MKLLRFGEFGLEKFGLELVENICIDVFVFGEDFNEKFFVMNGVERFEKWFEENKESCVVIKFDVWFGFLIVRLFKVVCVGLNYVKYVEESGMGILK